MRKDRKQKCKMVKMSALGPKTELHVNGVLRAAHYFLVFAKVYLLSPVLSKRTVASKKTFPTKN